MNFGLGVLRDGRSRNWILINIGSFAIATAAAFSVATSFENYDSIMFAPFAGLLVNSILGTAQGVWLSRLHQRLGVLWFIGTASAGLIGWWLAIPVMFFLANMMAGSWGGPWQFAWALVGGGLIMGATTGLVQMLILRKHIAKSSSWWRAATVGRGLGWFAAIPSILLFDVLKGQGLMEQTLILPVSLLGGAVLGLVYGWFTAMPLQQLWQSSTGQAAEPLESDGV